MITNTLMRTRRALVVLLAVLAAPPLHAGERFRLVLNGAISPTTRSFGETRTFTEFVETATVRADYETDSTFSPDVGIQAQVFGRLGVFLAFTSARRDESGRFAASLPHPLFFDRARSLEGDLAGYGYDERAVHLDLAYGGARGRLDYALFAGASLFSVEADLLDSVVYDHAYPYDSVTLREARPRAAKHSPAGFNAGGRLDYRFGKSRLFGLGVLLRFSAATARLPAPDATTVKVDAGGLNAGFGARLYF
ncbi:MAG TPA: hypothetical protein VLI67_04875 [Vicinamibacteria bacterium]|nr:hypothetical protein [Vicinamibacteria bacterium]